MKRTARTTVARTAWIVLIGASAIAALAGPVRAGEIIYAITPGNVLIRFDSATPGAVTTIGTVSGLGVRVPVERERPDRSNVNTWIGATRTPRSLMVNARIGMVNT